ncbi:hypothetical protein AB9K41_21825 [Cribrihabitans sp. XS_ASV171]
MRKVLTLQNSYPVPPDRLFDLVTDLDTLEAVARPWVRFHHLPSGPVREGQVIDIDLSLFGVLPAQAYKMVVTRMDRDARCMVSEERGAGVRKLVHVLQVAAGPGGGSILSDRIEIEAGWAMPFVSGFVWITHRWRHPVRRRLLRD